MLWDGVGFFGSDDTKLGRLKGKKVTWGTPFGSCKMNTLLILVLTISSFVIITEISHLGNQKT